VVLECIDAWQDFAWWNLGLSDLSVFAFERVLA